MPNRDLQAPHWVCASILRFADGAQTKTLRVPTPNQLSLLHIDLVTHPRQEWSVAPTLCPSEES